MDELHQSRLGFGKCHAVQVYPAFGLQLAALHSVEDLPIHGGRRRRCILDLVARLRSLAYREGLRCKHRGRLGLMMRFIDWFELGPVLGHWRGILDDLAPERLILG
ncbi:hypothetical protein [Vannielia litorea]|uniref:hypothetical protein n=1 Tax=Vannielia litorea TaxID=1217970 RepID=UPI003965793F